MLGRALKDVKLPFPDDFFPEAVVTNEDDAMYRRAAQAKVHETLRDENPATRFHPAQRTDQWKLVGDRMGMQLYRERGVAQGNAVQVVCVGALNGSLEDVMWGLYASTTPAFKTQRSILHADYLDACVLHVLDEEDCDEEDTAFSYSFSGIKWLATAAKGKLTMHKRDLCWHETMGLVHDASGQEVGYLTIQSVRINECPPFDQFGVVRSTANVCYIFRKQPNGSVGVYMKGDHAVGGKSRSWGSDPVIVETWLSIVNALECAHSKRLTRMLRDKDLFCATQNKQCEICDQKVRGLKAADNCKICGKNVCDKCRLSKAIYPSKATTQFPCMALFCKRCLSEVKDQSSGSRATRMSFHSDNLSSQGSGSSTYRQSAATHGAAMLYTNHTMATPPLAARPPAPPPHLGRTGSTGSTNSAAYYGYQPHYSESTVHSNSPTASTGSQSFASSDNFSESNSFRQPARPTPYSRGGQVSREPQSISAMRLQQQQQYQQQQHQQQFQQHQHQQRRDTAPRRPSQPQQHFHQPQKQPQQQQYTRYVSHSIDSDMETLESSFHGRMRLSSDPSILELNESSVGPVGELPTSRQSRAHTAGGVQKPKQVTYLDVSELHDDDEYDVYEVEDDVYDDDDDVHDVIELPSRMGAAVESGPVDVFHEDKLKYINSFSADASGNIANPSMPSAAANGSGLADEHQRLMERLLQANMTAEATYLLAKYSNNIAKNGSP